MSDERDSIVWVICWIIDGIAEKRDEFQNRHFCQDSNGFHIFDPIIVEKKRAKQSARREPLDINDFAMTEIQMLEFLAESGSGEVVTVDELIVREVEMGQIDTEMHMIENFDTILAEIQLGQRVEQRQGGVETVDIVATEINL